MLRWEPAVGSAVSVWGWVKRRLEVGERCEVDEVSPPPTGSAAVGLSILLGADEGVAFWQCMESDDKCPSGHLATSHICKGLGGGDR